MKRLFTLLLLCILGAFQSKAQVDVTFRVDLSDQGHIHSPRIFGNIAASNFSSSIDMTYVGDGIYEYTETGMTANPFILFNYYNPVSNATITEDTIPSECGADNSGAVSYHSFGLPATDDTITLKFNGCKVVTYKDGTWDNTPTDNDILKIEDDLTTSASYISNGIIVDTAATLTVGSGNFLEIGGASDLNQVIWSEDFDVAGGIPFVTGQLDGNTTLVMDGVDGSGQAVQVVYDASGAAGDIFLASVEGVAAGTYKFRFSTKVSAANLSNFAIINQNDFTGNSNYFNIVALTDSWEMAESNELTVPEGAKVQLSITFNSGFGNSVSGTVTFDDIELIRVDHPKEDILAVQSGASLITFDSLSNAYEATISRTTSFSGGKYSFVGTPVAGSAAITGSDLGSTTYSYDESIGYDGDAGLSRWEAAGTTQLGVGVGYAQAFQQDITFTGVPNDGDITLSGLSKTTTGTAAEGNQGWHLLSNPYPAAISVASFINANTSTTGAVYIWDDHGSESGRGDNSDYMTINAIGTVNAPNTSGKTFEGYIGSMQGFFVQVNTNGSSVSFTEEMRVTDQNADANFFRKSEMPKVKLSVNSKEGDHHETLVAWSNEATLNVDLGMDALGLSQEGKVRLFSNLNNENYTIQAVPETQSVQLSYLLAEKGAYELSVEEIAGANGIILLTDHHTQATYTLEAGTKIAFDAETLASKDRFSLSYTSGDLTEAASQLEAHSVYSLTENKLVVSLGAAVEDIVVTDLQGRKLQVTHQIDGDAAVISTESLSGVFVINVTTDNTSWVKKFKF